MDHPHDHGATAFVAADREDLASLARHGRLAYPPLTGQRLQGRRDDLPDWFLGLRSTGVHHLALVRTRAECGPVEAARAFQVSIALASSQCSSTVADQSGISRHGSVLAGMLFWNYYLCVKTSPGSVPRGWVRPSLHDLPSLSGAQLDLLLTSGFITFA